MLQRCSRPASHQVPGLPSLQHNPETAHRVRSQQPDKAERQSWRLPHATDQVCCELTGSLAVGARAVRGCPSCQGRKQSVPSCPWGLLRAPPKKTRNITRTRQKSPGRYTQAAPFTGGGAGAATALSPDCAHTPRCPSVIAGSSRFRGSRQHALVAERHRRAPHFASALEQC